LKNPAFKFLTNPEKKKVLVSKPNEKLSKKELGNKKINKCKFLK
jgi:hypothetical protein